MPGQEPVPRGLQPGQRERIGERPGAQGGIGLQQLGERVHPVGRDPHRVVARQEVRIDHRIRRDQALVPERALVAVRPTLADHGVPGCLAAGAGGGGHRDERHRRPLVRTHPGQSLEVLDHAGAGPQQTGDRLGRIEHGPAAHAQDHVHGLGPVLGLGPVRRHRRVHDRRRRLVRDGDLARDCHPRGSQPRQQRLAPPGCRQRPPSRDQEDAAPVPGHHLRHPRESP